MMYSLKVLLEADLKDKDSDRNKDVTSGLENDEPLSEVLINRIKSIIASKLNSLNVNNLDDRLGRLNLNNLKNIGRIAVKGKYYIDPAQVKSGQSKGATMYDIVQFKKIQLVPFFVYNDKGDNFNAENAHDSYNLLFVVPAMDVEIDEKNMKEHENLFSKQKGFTIQKKYESLSASQVAAFKIKDDELSKFMKAAFISGNTSPTASIITSQPSRRSSPQSESLELVRNKENIVDNYNIIKTYNSNSHRKNSSMNDIFSGKLSNYLFENNQGEQPNVSVLGRADAFKNLNLANKFAGSFNTTRKSITSIISTFEHKGLVPAINVKKIISNENSLQIIPFIKKDEQDILAVEKNNIQQVVLEIIPIPNIKINEKNKEFFQAFFGIEGELPPADSTYKFSDIDFFKTVFLPIKKDLETSIKELEAAILAGNSNVLLKLNNISKQGTISTNPSAQQQSQQKEQEVQTESFIHTQGDLSSLLFETKLMKDNLEKYLKDEVFDKAGKTFPQNLISNFEKALRENMPGASEVEEVKVFLEKALKEIRSSPQDYDSINGTNISKLSKSKMRFLSGMLVQMVRSSKIIFEQKKAEEADDGKRDKKIASETGLVVVTPTASSEEDKADDASSAGVAAIESEPEARTDDESESESEEESSQEASAKDNFPENFIDFSPDINKSNIENSLALFAAIYKKLKGEDLTGTITFKKFYLQLAMLTHPDSNSSNPAYEPIFKFVGFLYDYITKFYAGSKKYNVIVEGVDKENKLIKISKELTEKYLQKLSSGGNISIDNDDDDVKTEKLSAEEAEKFATDRFSLFEELVNKVIKYINLIDKGSELVRFVKEEYQGFYLAFVSNTKILQNLQEEFNIDTIKINLEKMRSLYEKVNDLLEKKRNEFLNSENQEKVEEIIDDQKENTTLAKSDVEEQKEKILSTPEFIKLSREKRAYIDDLLSKSLNNRHNSTQQSASESEEESDLPAESAQEEEIETASEGDGGDEKDTKKEESQPDTVTGAFKAKILDLYNKKISIDNADEIMTLLKSKSDEKLKIILDVISMTESFIYKSLGLSLLLEADDDTPKKLEKIDINVIFSNIQKTLYSNTILDKQAADIKDLLDKNTKTSNMGEIFKAASKFLGMTRARFDDIWSWSPSGPDYKLDLSKTIAYGICESILEDKESFTEKGFEIVGSLKKLDDIRLGGGNILYSDRTYSRLAQEMKKAGGDGNKFEELSREELNEKLDESVKKVILDIAIAQHMKYDEDLKAIVKPKLEKWRKSDEMSQSSYKKIKSGFTRKKAGRIGLGLGLAAIIASPVALAGLASAGTIAAAGAIGYGLGKDADEETFTSRKDIWSKEPEVKQSADKLFEVVTSLAADIKDIYLESKSSYIKGSLTGLLFENLLIEADAKELTYEDIRKTLKSNDILAFGFPDVENRKEAEVSLVESVGGMLEDTFDIKIKGIKNGAAALAMERLTSSVDKDAEKGSPAVKEVSEMTAGAGVPPSMKDAMSPEQFMMMMNMSGGPIMMMFMQMMAQQQFQQQMMQMFEQMQKGKVSGLRAAETVEKASAGKLSAVEKALEEALKSYNATKPALNVEDARKIILTLKENKTLIDKQVKDIIKKINKSKSDGDKIEEFSLKNINAKSILKDLKNYVKIVKDEKTDDKIFDSLNINIFTENNEYVTPLTTTLMILVIKDGNAEETIKKINSLNLFAKNATLVKGLISNLSKSIKIRVEESRVRNDLFVGRLTERLFESNDTGNKVLSKNKPVKNSSYNSEYLQAETKRIWKI